MRTSREAETTEHGAGDVSPPSIALLLRESLALAELGAYLMAIPLWPAASRGDGHPVLVLPGLLQSDLASLPMRMFLGSRGYRVYGWRYGRNTGRDDVIDQHLVGRVAALHARHGRKVSLIGWSLGGLFARALARKLPDAVRQVITLGSPFGSPKASNVWRLYEFASGRQADGSELRDRFREPPQVPTTSIFSRKDGVVAWRACLHESRPHAENIEVTSSHCGMGYHPEVLFAIADRLAQPEDDWRPFATASRCTDAWRSGGKRGRASQTFRGEPLGGRGPPGLNLSGG